MSHSGSARFFGEHAACYDRAHESQRAAKTTMLKAKSRLTRRRPIRVTVERYTLRIRRSSALCLLRALPVDVGERARVGAAE